MSEYAGRLEAVEKLLQLFRYERLAYLVVTALALAMLLVPAKRASAEIARRGA